MAFIRILYHVLLAVQRAVTTPSVMASSVVRCFVPALLSSSSLFTCLLARLIIQLLFFYWWLWRVWNLYLTDFQNGIIFLYSYWSQYRYYFLVFNWSPVSILFSCIVISIVLITRHAITWHLTLTFYHLTPVWYHLSPALLNTWLLIIIIWESCPAILYYIQ